jgi:hypothetical protein
MQTESVITASAQSLAQTPLYDENDVDAQATTVETIPTISNRSLFIFTWLLLIDRI